MSSTYYTSLSGMMAASYGLQNTSNNVANMQSPGFKRRDVFYASLGHDYGESSLGNGVRIAGGATNFSDGNYLDSNSASDLAIIGQGFFIIKLPNGSMKYTRNGQFDFNSEGVLIDRRSKGEVQGYNSAGNLVPIYQKGPKTASGKASTELYLKGQFVLKEKEDPMSEPGPLKNKYQDIKFSVANVYDAQGKAHQVYLEFESTRVVVNDTIPDPIPGPSDPTLPDNDSKKNTTTIPDKGFSWDLKNVICYDADISISFAQGQQIVFNEKDQAPTLESCSLTFNINQQAVQLNFGNFKGSNDETVLLKDSSMNTDSSSIDVLKNNGYSEGKQTACSFDEDGLITYHYDNNQNITGVYVGLARFDDMEHTLIPGEDSLFKAKDTEGMHIGRPNTNAFGTIQSNKIESANVDSTTEFANIVVLQRMFQACSQIMDIDKQLLESLES